MKQIIARLLQDFEAGSMNRRQLIESLALAASAAAAMQGSAEAQTGAAFKTVDVDHISYQVSDYRVTRDFYADLMGMTVAKDDGKAQCQLQFGNSFILARNRTQGNAPTAAADGGPRPVTSLVDHICYRLSDWNTEHVKEQLLRRKLVTDAAVRNAGPNATSFTMRDPDGYMLQISGSPAKP